MSGRVCLVALLNCSRTLEVVRHNTTRSKLCWVNIDNRYDVLQRALKPCPFGFYWHHSSRSGAVVTTYTHARTQARTNLETHERTHIHM